MALFTNILEQAYPDEFLDTSDGALMKISPQKRAWFLERAKKQDMEEALLKSFALRITESKKALAKLSLQKAKECAKPFYFTAAIGDIMTNSTAAAVGSAEQTQNLMQNGTDAVKNMVNGKINNAKNQAIDKGKSQLNRLNPLNNGH